MTSRRLFLKQTAALAAGAAGVAGIPAGKAEPPTGSGSSPAALPGNCPAAGLPPGRVPDTLDLAEHGRLALGGMLGSLDPAVDYEAVFLALFDVHPAYMLHWSSMVSGVMPKYVEALPLLRLMSGSREADGPARRASWRRCSGTWPTTAWSTTGPARIAPGTPASDTASKAGTRTMPTWRETAGCWPD